MKIKFIFNAFMIVSFSGLSGTMINNASAEINHINPVDEVSNPQKLDYKDIEVRRPDFSEKFLRDGIIDQPQRLQKLQKGISINQALRLLGQPINRKIGKNGDEWDYNIKLKMNDSENYIVCQYKIIVDENNKVIENTVWRRKQCLNIANETKY